MNDISTLVAHEGKDGSDNSSEEGSSPQRQENSRSNASFWARALRLLRPAQGERLREDLADALMTDVNVSNAFSPEERAMLHNILRFREVRVEDIMVPRADIEAVDMTMTLGDLMIHFEETGRSRMPVYCDTLDDPRGFVHIRDLLSYLAKQARNKRRASPRATAPSQRMPLVDDKVEKPARGLKAAFDLGRVDLSKSVADAGLVRKILFVPPSMLASDLLQSMQAARTQMALVIDEYGGTDGLVSHEDIVEMVIGDVEDEHDDEEVMFSRAGEDIFIADARIELEEIAEAIGPDFDIRDRMEDVDTLGGLLFSALGRIPVRGEVVQALPGFEFHILDADPRRIKRVRVVRKRPLSRRRHAKGEAEGMPPDQASAPAASGIGGADVEPAPDARNTP
ncbi:magnesium/cobalt efflux protein [Pseudorhizobium endolithicum]|uniref:Magnesium/cobalt efflux protein n=1 Tax=Pseudorhizobium endolithicum TaxID=1191678 RepID=A0ABN7JWS3_9HYPH|nr:hemolysin family protein [Pseudorhizobium endolithicum]CAD6426732.1 HlyC/CorC family transporter [Rhizobium sp. Q54]CAD7052125.1 magnesium/cobalt efflux protein [Pseudorhizobium endolithicum]